MELDSKQGTRPKYVPIDYSEVPHSRLTWHVPSDHQGEMIEVSYGGFGPNRDGWVGDLPARCPDDWWALYRREYDRSDGTLTYYILDRGES